MDWAKVVEVAIVPAALLVFFWPVRKHLSGDWAGLRAFLANFRGKAAATGPAGLSVSLEIIDQQNAPKENPAQAELPQSPTAITAPTTGSISEILPPADREAVRVVEHTILSQLQEIPAGNREAILVRALSLSRMESGHEFVYNRIFGSQIAALKRLVEVGHATVNEAREFFQPYADRYPEVYNTYGFEGWWSFLTNMGLAKLDNGQFTVTVMGQDFLAHLEARNLSDQKGL